MGATMRWLSCFSFALLFASAAEVAAEDQPSVAVMKLRSEAVEPRVLTALDALLVFAVDRIGPYKVITSDDINSMLGAEKMKEALGCDDVTCAAELGGALGVRYLLSGSVNQLGTKLYLTVTLINSEKQSVEARGKADVENDENLFEKAVIAAVGSLFGKDTDPLWFEAAKLETDAVMFDGFGDASIDSTRWGTDTSHTGQVTATDGKIRTTVRAGGRDGNEYHVAKLGGKGLWLVEGDFDIQVDYRALALPDLSSPAEDIGVQLIIFVPGRDELIAVNRSHLGPSRSGYAMWMFDGGAWHGDLNMRSHELQGRLRLVREGAVISAFAW